MSSMADAELQVSKWDKYWILWPHHAQSLHSRVFSWRGDTNIAELENLGPQAQAAHWRFVDELGIARWVGSAPLHLPGWRTCNIVNVPYPEVSHRLGLQPLQHRRKTAPAKLQNACSLAARGSSDRGRRGNAAR